MNMQDYSQPRLPRLDPRTGRMIPAPVRRQRLLAGPVPQIPAEWMNAPLPAPQPDHCGISQQAAQCAVDQLRPLNFVRAENVLLALITGGVIGYFIGKEGK